jgi:hypothetical protein
VSARRNDGKVKAVSPDLDFDGVRIGALWGSPVPQIHLEYTEVKDPKRLLEYLSQESGVTTEIQWGYVGEGKEFTRTFIIRIFPGRNRDAFSIPFNLNDQNNRADGERIRYLIDFLKFVIRTKTLRVYNLVMQEGGYFLGNNVIFTWNNTEILENQVKFLEERLEEIKKEKGK